MYKFQIGDVLERISGIGTVMPIGYVGRVIAVADFGEEQYSIMFAGYSEWWYGVNFKKIGERY